MIADTLRAPGDSRLAPLLAGGAAALNFGLATFSVWLMSETVALFLLTLGVLFGLRSAKCPRLAGLALSAFLMALATYTRVAYCWYVVPFALVLLLYRVPWRGVGLFVAVYFLSLLPWAVRNTVHFGEFMLSRSANHHLLFYFIPAVQNMTMDETLEFQGETSRTFSEAHGGASHAECDNTYADEYVAIAMDYLRQAGAARVLWVWLKRVVRTAGAVQYANYTRAFGIPATPIGHQLEKKNVVQAVIASVKEAPSFLIGSFLFAELAMMLLQVLSGLLILLDRGAWRRSAFLALTLAYLLAVGGIQSGSRPRVALDPWLCICLGFAIAMILRLRHRRPPDRIHRSLARQGPLAEH